MGLNWTYYKAITVYVEIQAFETNGTWPNSGAPDWAQNIGNNLQVAMGNDLIFHIALREITRVFAIELGLNCAN